MFTTLTGVTSELKQPEIDTNLVPESEIRPNLHISYDFYGKQHWYNPLSNKTYLLRTDDFRRQPNRRGRSGASLLVLTAKVAVRSGPRSSWNHTTDSKASKLQMKAF